MFFNRINVNWGTWKVDYYLKMIQLGFLAFSITSFAVQISLTSDRLWMSQQKLLSILKYPKTCRMRFMYTCWDLMTKPCIGIQLYPIHFTLCIISARPNPPSSSTSRVKFDGMQKYYIWVYENIVPKTME